MHSSLFTFTIHFHDLLFQINEKRIVFKRDENTPDTITEEYLLEKANKLGKLQDLLQTHIIKDTTFRSNPQSSTKLLIELERKNKEKKKKNKQKQQKLTQ